MGLLDSILSNNSGGGLFDSLFYPTSAPDAGAEKKKQDAAFLAAIGQDPYQGVSNPNATPTFQQTAGNFPNYGTAPLAGTNAGAYGGSSPFGLGGFNLPAAPQGAPASGVFPAVPAMQSPQAPQAAPQMAPAPLPPQMAPPQMAAPAPNGPTGSMNIGGYQMPQFGNRADYTPQASAPSTDISAQSRQPQPDQSQGLPPALQPRDFLSRIGNPDGLIARLTGNDSRSVARENLRAEYEATRQALIGNGTDPNQANRIAMLAVMNKDAGKVVLPELLSNRQKFEKLKDGFGNEVPTFVDTVGHTVTDARTGQPYGQGGSAASGDMQAMTDKITQMRTQGASKEQMLGMIPTGYRDDVASLIAGKAVPANMGRSEVRGKLITLAKTVDPNFDETLIPARVAMRKDFAGEGKNGQAIGAFNTVQHHIDQVSDAAEEYYKAGGGSNYPTLNSIKNSLANNTGLDPKLRDAGQKLVDKMNAAEHEVTSAYNAGHITNADRETWQTIKSSNLPANQLRQRLADFEDLLAGKSASLNHMYRTTFGEDAPTIDKAANEATLNKVHNRLAGGQSGYSGPSGGVQNGATATNPQTGQKITFRNGKWQ